MDDNDLKILEGVKKYIGNPKFIFDLGANRGSYTDFVLSLFPDVHMILFEPNSIWFNHLRQKYSSNLRIDVKGLLVGNKIGDSIFYYFTNNNDQLSSIYKRPVFFDLPMQETSKSMVTLDFIIENCSPYVDFIKVDTEGAEFDVLKGAEKSLREKRIKFLQIEYGGTYPDAGITMKEVIEFVNSFGYKAYSYNGSFTELHPETFVEDFHYDNYLISSIEL